MKNKLILNIIVALILTSFSIPALHVAAEYDRNAIVRPIELVVNGQFVSTDVKPLTDQGRLFVPIRALASLGLSYSFNVSTKTTTVQNKNGDYLKLTVNKNSAVKNGNVIAMEAPAQNKNGRILVPIRFISEHLGSSVYFESIRKFVFVNANDYTFNPDVLNQDDLQAARKAAIALPIFADFKTISADKAVDSHSYRFPVGRADYYFFQDGITTIVDIKQGKATALGQLYEVERSTYKETTGILPPDVILDQSPVNKPFHEGSVFFYVADDETAGAAYDLDRKFVNMKVYSDIIQRLPDDF